MNAERHSFSATTFNKYGQILQIEYANETGMRGEPVVGIRASDGIVVAAEKYLEPKLAIPRTVVKVANLGRGMAISYAGLRPDFHMLYRRAQTMNDIHFARYGRRMTIRNMLNNLSATMQEYCQASGFRPFGLSLMLIGWEYGKTRIFHLKAEGSYALYKALAIGVNAEERMDYIHKYYNRKITLDFAILLALYAIRQDCLQPLVAENYEVGISNEEGFRHLHMETIEAYVRDME